MRVMYDSITPDAIPVDANTIAGYVDGDWPTYDLLHQRYPHAQLLSIAVFHQDDAHCLDIENGDAQPHDAPPWAARQHARGITPWLYSDISTAPQVIQALAEAGIPRERYIIWSAHDTGQAHICAPSTCGATTTADGTQWTFHAQGLNLDESLLTDHCFPTPYWPPDELRWERQYDQLHTRRNPAARARTRALQRAMRRRELQILHHARDQPNGWHQLNRQARYRALLTRI